MARHLLTIPLELRDEILRYVLLSRRIVANQLEEIEKQDREVLADVKLKSRAIAQVKYSAEPADYMPTALPLLLTNKQLNIEVHAALPRTPGKGTSYELDVKIVQERYLAPTWVSVPFLSEQVSIPHYDPYHVSASKSATIPISGFIRALMVVWERPQNSLRVATLIVNLNQQVHSVRVVFQTCGILETTEEMTIWRECPRVQSLFIWLLYSLLERFLHVGPVSRRMNNTKRNISIGTLELDFVDPEELDLLADEQYKSNWVAERRAHNSGIGVTRPAWICKLVEHQLLQLLHLSMYEIPFGTIMYERIGDFVLKVNGTMQRKFHLGKMLGEMTYNRYLGQSPLRAKVAKWIEWKLDTVEKRKRRNLGYVGLEDGWFDEAWQQAYRTEYRGGGGAPHGANDHGYVYRQILPRPGPA
ncbi:hypothetical protein BDV96DRAFT_641977 [Lophiotrema nucula]|uniref:F-box domain-containing protein n=1 Tax=Lophiotrema nucula TaxID=690887 RepID=A0A6A5ZMA1_9PLEO|nr:hypothetical protein BDV96DRAFT_641977 [Lophiotrema nucula]